MNYSLFFASVVRQLLQRLMLGVFIFGVLLAVGVIFGKGRPTNGTTLASDGSVVADSTPMLAASPNDPEMSSILERYAENAGGSGARLGFNTPDGLIELAESDIPAINAEYYAVKELRARLEREVARHARSGSEFGAELTEENDGEPGAEE